MEPAVSTPPIHPLPGLPGGPRRKIGRMLLSRGLVNLRQLSHAVTVQRAGLEAQGLPAGARLGTILLHLGYVSPLALVRALCDQAGKVDFLAFGRYLVEPPLARVIPRELAREMGVLPLVRLPEAGVLLAAGEVPSALTVVRLERRLRVPVEPIVVRERDFDRVIEACYDELDRRGTTPARLGEILVREQLASAEEVAEALVEARRLGRPIGEVLVARGLLDERVVYVLLARQHGLRLVTARQVVHPREAAPLVARLTTVYVRHNQVLPYRQAGKVVFAVTSDPRLDTAPLAEALGCEAVTLQLACRSELADLVEEACRLSVA